MQQEKDKKQSLITRPVTMDRALTRAAHGLTLSEKRLMLCAIGALDSKRVVTIDNIPVTRVTAAEYAQLAQVDMPNAYVALKQAGEHLTTRRIRFYRPQEGDNPAVNVVMQWVGEAHYCEGAGWIELYWWPRIIPFLVNLKNQFTSFPLGQMVALRSTYSTRLAELLLDFKDTGVLVISVEELAHAMDANEKQRADFAKIRTRMIEPAVKELVEKNKWDITWRAVKHGRTVKTLRFDFDTKLPKVKDPAVPRRTRATVVSPAAQPSAFVPPKPPAKRTPEQLAKAREALETAKKAARGNAE